MLRSAFSGQAWTFGTLASVILASCAPSDATKNEKSTVTRLTAPAAQSEKVEAAHVNQGPSPIELNGILAGEGLSNVRIGSSIKDMLRQAAQVRSEQGRMYEEMRAAGTLSGSINPILGVGSRSSYRQWGAEAVGDGVAASATCDDKIFKIEQVTDQERQTLEDAAQQVLARYGEPKHRVRFPTQYPFNKRERWVYGEADISQEGVSRWDGNYLYGAQPDGFSVEITEYPVSRVGVRSDTQIRLVAFSNALAYQAAQCSRGLQRTAVPTELVQSALRPASTTVAAPASPSHIEPQSTPLSEHDNQEEKLRDSNCRVASQRLIVQPELRRIAARAQLNGNYDAVARAVEHASGLSSDYLARVRSAESTEECERLADEGANLIAGVLRAIRSQ